MKIYINSESFQSTQHTHLFFLNSLSLHRKIAYCMAANSQSRRIASLGKRFVSQIRTSSAVDPTLTLRRAVHVSVYDKNIDDQGRPTLVPDEAITRAETDTYWAPHPKTGVFGPADEKNPRGPSESEPATSNGSVLEEKAFYRPLENLEKPAHP